MIRYAEFYKVENGQIRETALFIDLLHLTVQVGLTPFPRQTGMILSSLTAQHDGLLLEAQDTKEGGATLALINRTIGDINNGYYTSPRKTRQCWHEDMLWWGPAGIGATYTIDRYIDQHQRPFRT